MATAQIIDVIFRGRNDADAAIRSVEDGLAKVDKVGEGVGRTSNSLDGMVTRLGQVGPLLAAAFGVASVAALATEFVRANVELEKFTLAVTQIRGSGTLASQELDYLRSVSDRLGLSVSSTSSAYVSLLAATKGTALEGAQSRDIFEAVASAMSRLGRSSAETEGALLAIQQMISKGTVSSEELRGQLGERLPGAFQIAARSIGVTTQELGKLLEGGKIIAEEFLPVFARELNNTFGGGADRVDGYTASLNRLKNQFEETLQLLGNSGVFDALTSSLEGAAKAAQAVGGGIDYLSRVFGATQNLLRGGSFEVFNAELEIARQRADTVSVALSGGLNESLAETARLSRQAAEAGAFFGDQSDAETERLQRQANAQANALKEVNDAFKTLGVNPDKIKGDVDKVLQAFETLSNSPDVRGDQLLAGLEATLKKIEDARYLPQLKDQLQQAYEQGRITGGELAKGFAAIAKEQDGLDKKLPNTTKAIADQAREAEKARDKAQQYALELEKLASNERIKLIEARVTLNVTEVQEQTKRIQAAFASLDNTVNSTADVINKAFGALSGNSMLDSSVRNQLFAQVERENQNRQEALRQQSDLTRAQIRVLESQARNLDSGEALIKVDGSGLAPHLEAIMWEILKQAQVRTNRDGLKLLLGA
jgi:tape measure domain-containing protein